ncbi:sodium:solute symporter family protein [Rufibacter glacialis]|uniref:Sodium:solute symporter n=1 Tax=Rufibacter glacialis TaxID=1259555 RepID=A0A5M8QQX5_9BACT|nr:sodium:solute symporter family protein [Rufibacter glacialis]KAA6437450.1 sodium:solute symporter [Rufibacter glacialis]GGK59235.1 sodium:solute symporter [Rufibacter glacialis]
MLIFFVLLYLAFNVALGLWAARRVQNTSDFMLAGRSLPLPMATAVVFATWFGSETILGASAEVAEEGLIGMVEDPLGASLCLVLVGLFFARKLYRMNLLTFGDFYRVKFGRTAEIIASFFLVISYFGWVAAQMVALGIAFNLLLGTTLVQGILLGSFLVVLYTYFGGMWSVSLTDYVQTIMIILGLFIVTWWVVQEKPLAEVTATLPPDFYRITPATGTSFTGWLNYLALWMTIGLGSIPQQDVFQRVMASKSEKVAVQASLLAAFLYVTVALLPLVLAIYAKVLHPELAAKDAQMLVPSLILGTGPLVIKVLFFGALISAIISTASGAILAPASILSENLLRPLFQHMTDKKLLALSRACVLVVAVISLGFALSKNNIHELVSESSALSLVSLLVPLVAGVYLKNPSREAAILSMVAGMTVWLLCLALDTSLNPMLYGLAASVAGYGLGLLWPTQKKHLPLQPEKATH